MADLSELGSLSAVRVLPQELLALPPEVTLDPGTVYWLSGTTLRPVAQEQMEALLPQAGSVTLAANPNAPAGAGADANQPANNDPQSSNIPADDLDNLTRAALIPIFIVIAQVEGMEAVTRGALDGFKAGLEDDYQMLTLLGKGLVFVGGLTAQGMGEIASWRTDRKKRTEAFLALAGHISEEFVFKPIREFHQEISTWEGFKRRAFQLYELQNKFIDFHLQAFVVAKDNAPQLVDAMTSWMDDFGNRMLVESENTVFAEASWNKDTLVGDFMEQNRYVCYTFGHTFGYIVEQVLSGVVQAGVGKIATKMATVLLKGGQNIAGNVLKRSAFAVAGKMHVLKQYLAGVWSRSEMGFVGTGIGNATKQPVNRAIKKTLTEELEEHLARTTVINRNSFNTRKILDIIAEGPNLKRLVATEAGKDAVWQRLSLFTHLMGEQADEALMTNFLKVMDQKLIYDVGGQPVDWAEDFLLCFQNSAFKFTTPRPVIDVLEDWQKQLLKGFLEGPGLGDLYKLDSIDGRGRSVRGILVEMDFHHRQFIDWNHTPSGSEGFAVDWTKAPRAVQMKSINSATDWQEENLAGAINDLIDWQKTNQNVTLLTLSIKKNPSLDSQGLEGILLDYIDLLKLADDFPDGVEIVLDVKPFVFMP